jgi:hypothetical protein
MPSHTQILKVTLPLKNPRAISLKILGWITALISVVKSTNLITDFPSEVYIHEKDRVGFQLHKFMNSSMIDASYYQKPFLDAYVGDKIIQQLVVNYTEVDKTDPKKNV